MLLRKELIVMYVKRIFYDGYRDLFDVEKKYRVSNMVIGGQEGDFEDKICVSIEIAKNIEKKYIRQVK